MVSNIARPRNKLFVLIFLEKLLSTYFAQNSHYFSAQLQKIR